MDCANQGRHPPTQLAAMVVQTNAEHEAQTWYADSEANNHVTPDLESLADQQAFQGPDSEAVGNGEGLQILHTGSSSFYSSQSKFHLRHILHCPSASINLLSIQRFCRDNDCYFQLTASHFFVKDMQRGALLFQGKSENGLYPIQLQRDFIKNKSRGYSVAFLGVKTYLSGWHSRSEHPSSVIVQSVIKSQHLPISHADSNKIVLCESRQLGKSKKQPFSSSTPVT